MHQCSVQTLHYIEQMSEQLEYIRAQAQEHAPAITPPLHDFHKTLTLLYTHSARHQRIGSLGAGLANPSPMFLDAVKKLLQIETDFQIQMDQAVQTLKNTPLPSELTVSPTYSAPKIHPFRVPNSTSLSSSNTTSPVAPLNPSVIASPQPVRRKNQEPSTFSFQPQHQGVIVPPKAL